MRRQSINNNSCSKIILQCLLDLPQYSKVLGRGDFIEKSLIMLNVGGKHSSWSIQNILKSLALCKIT
ncbi:hypothetical protein XELAEV_18012812mg [Xenopus laevis]|uniref:Uncharacterized protein n=1 Tax=Xenopus laevis TaxID=8355 RepID=A0A974DNC5_XENLA|nr:hypothetical protein XELAEV_18012812mg [Xenopus laevis]